MQDHMPPIESEQEQDEVDLRSRVPAICRELQGQAEPVEPGQRPLELIQLIDEEVTRFRQYQALALAPDVGRTDVLDFGGGIKAIIRHFYPEAQSSQVDVNERGAAAGERRLVPASLLWRDIMCDDVFVGRFAACLTKPNSQAAEANFCLHILVLTVCGNRHVRENITFRGTRSNGHEAFSAVSPWDLSFVGQVFESLEQEFGRDGFEFLAHEAIRSRYFLSQMIGHDIGLPKAFDAYTIQFGSYVTPIVRQMRERIVALAQSMSHS